VHAQDRAIAGERAVLPTTLADPVGGRTARPRRRRVATSSALAPGVASRTAEQPAKDHVEE